MLHIVFWIVFGALVGWIAAILQDQKQFTPLSLALILTGVIGGLIGGTGGALLSREAASYDAQIGGMMFAVLGAIGLLLIAHAAASSSSKHSS